MIGINSRCPGNTNTAPFLAAPAIPRLPPGFSAGSSSVATRRKTYSAREKNPRRAVGALVVFFVVSGNVCVV